MHGDQYPYVIPLCYTYHNNSVYFHARKKGQKLNYIKNNNRVCFQVDKVKTLKTASSPCDYSLKYTSVIIYGQAEEVHDFNEKELVNNFNEFYYNEVYLREDTIGVFNKENNNI